MECLAPNTIIRLWTQIDGPTMAWLSVAVWLRASPVASLNVRPKIVSDRVFRGHRHVVSFWRGVAFQSRPQIEI
jgi:hypothetical protein